MRDQLRPSGTVELECQRPGCGWSFWVSVLDKRLPEGPFLCPTCMEESTGVLITKKADHVNRHHD
jgi:hypothetical protein